jgi:UDP-3-O-[3-hydroxymyristoyl] N-acetylglucosamine deacetylase
VEDKHKRISILPDETFRLTCDTDYPAPVGRQSLELEVTPERYAAQIAFARTFGWEADLNQMRDMGLIRGASLENAVCFTPTGTLNPEGCARRRMLPA